VSVEAGRHRAAVLGKPVRHSLSPVLHNAGYVAAGLSGWAYAAYEVDEDGLAGFVAGLGPEWAGLSMTMPLKHAALRVADEVGEAAELLGAANTLVLHGGRRRVENTDAPGLLDALAEAGVKAADRVAIVGSGGTARAALYAAAVLGAAQIHVYTRRPAAAAELTPVADRLGVPVTGAAWTDPAPAETADVVFSTVPAGAADDFARAVRWRPDATVFDVLYADWPTRLAVTAADAGCRVLSGLDLLLAQAVRQFELFTGVPAPTGAMRTALQAAAVAD
jgi:shikimate-5-dehydrogenase